MHLSRTRFFSSVLILLFAGISWAHAGVKTPKIAGITTVYHTNSHADMILGRLIEGNKLDGGAGPNLHLSSLYVDQFPSSDMSVRLTEQNKIPLYTSVRDTLTLGTNKLCVDGVMLVCEHGRYPKNMVGATIYPKLRLFKNIIQTFDEVGKVAPIFIDKHLADNWADAKWIYDEAKKRNIPLMAGSSIPITWRKPAADINGEKLEEIVMISYHTLDAYTIHALEGLQALAERREGGETGVTAIRFLRGKEVWNSIYKINSLIDHKLYEVSTKVLGGKAGSVSSLTSSKAMAVIIEYRDGTKASVITPNGPHAGWAAAWKIGDEIHSTHFWTHEARPMMHFSRLVNILTKFFETGEPQYPVERTLLTTGILATAFVDNFNGSYLTGTQFLYDVQYKSNYKWEQPNEP